MPARRPFLCPIFPVLRLKAADRTRFARHLLALDRDERYCRFGSSLRDEGIGGFVDALDFRRELLLGAADAAGEIIAVAQISSGAGALAELAVSVGRPWRRRGLAGLLFAEALRRAGRAGLAGFACLHGHPAILRLAVRHGLAVRFLSGEPRAVINFALPAADLRAVAVPPPPCSAAPPRSRASRGS